MIIYHDGYKTIVSDLMIGSSNKVFSYVDIKDTNETRKDFVKIMYSTEAINFLISNMRPVNFVLQEKLAYIISSILLNKMVAQGPQHVLTFGFSKISGDDVMRCYANSNRKNF